MKTLTLILLLALAGCGTERPLASAEYCEMWGIWHASGGAYGWPDTANRHARECPVLAGGEL